MADVKEIRFEIKSAHPDKSALDLVDEINGALPQICEDLRPEYGTVELELQLDETVPIDPVTMYFTLKAVVLAGVTGAAAGAGKKLGEDLYNALKKRFKNSSIQHLQNVTGRRRQENSGSSPS